MCQTSTAAQPDGDQADRHVQRQSADRDHRLQRPVATLPAEPQQRCDGRNQGQRRRQDQQEVDGANAGHGRLDRRHEVAHGGEVELVGQQR